METPRRRLTRRSAISWKRVSGSARKARSAFSRTCATSGTSSTRSASTTVSTGRTGGSWRSRRRSRTPPGTTTCLRLRGPGEPGIPPGVAAVPFQEIVPRLPLPRHGDRLRLAVPRAGRDDRRPHGRLREGGADLRRNALPAPPACAGTLYSALLRYPLMTARVAGAIYWQAMRLWMKRAPFYTHPSKKKNS